MQSTVWTSCDLGVNGDYEGPYSWLDVNGAKECGASVALLTYIHSGDLLECLRKDIDDNVSLDKRSRIYVVRRDGEQIKGSYLVGRRKGAPWEGYGEIDDESDDSA
ncbi:MAG: hypothetical protein OXP09_11015 [Gammaproteobacteria bacterium]|nr:hypothetical protein [Gammaproteobacteria bacterium]MDE0366089.1 hypothetical protein [Gammaproteobacteria bacterium]